MMLVRTAIPLLAVISWTSIIADELVYAPVNPSFGGSSLNGNWLLSQAQAQDTFKDDDSEDLAESELDKFNATLERIVLSRLASELTRSFLDGELPVLETDNFIISTETSDDGQTTITTTDKATGDSIEFVIGEAP